MGKGIQTTALISFAFFATAYQGCEEEPDLTYYSTCGDPVCSGHTDQSDIPLCTDEKEMAACTEEGMMCDPLSDCNAMLVCAEEDPKQQQGGCPISREEFKEDINYLNQGALEDLHQQMMTLPLATYHYKNGADKGKERLGFILEDAPGALCADEPRDMVDVYAYASMAVAALKVQQQQIETLKSQVIELQSLVKTENMPSENKAAKQLD